MSEWKELKIDNLPSDILVEGKYEIADYDSYQGIYVPTTLHPVDCLSNIITSKGDYTYFYRAPEPQPKTHEEIMTLWWSTLDTWVQVLGYKENYYTILDRSHNFGLCEVKKQWFTNRESAVFPPEAL